MVGQQTAAMEAIKANAAIMQGANAQDQTALAQEEPAPSRPAGGYSSLKQEHAEVTTAEPHQQLTAREILATSQTQAAPDQQHVVVSQPKNSHEILAAAQTDEQGRSAGEGTKALSARDVLAQQAQNQATAQEFGLTAEELTQQRQLAHSR